MNKSHLIIFAGGALLGMALMASVRQSPKTLQPTVAGMNVEVGAGRSETLTAPSPTSPWSSPTAEASSDFATETAGSTSAVSSSLRSQPSMTTSWPTRSMAPTMAAGNSYQSLSHGAPMSVEAHQVPPANLPSARPVPAVHFVKENDAVNSSLGMGTGGGNSSVAVELDRGVQVPMALLPPDEPLAPAQEAARKQTQQTFENEINAAAASGKSGAEADQAWNEARERANEHYRILYGQEKSNRASVQAGVDALATP